MSPLRLTGSTSGYSQIDAPAVAGDQTFTLPGTGGTIVTTAGTQTLTNKTIQGGTITAGTSVASTSGTSIDFTGIPSWVKRITVMFNGVSTTGNNSVYARVRLGTSSGVETTSYTNAGGYIINAAATGVVASTSGFDFYGDAGTGGRMGNIVLANITGNTWVLSGTLTASTGSVFYYLAGSKTLSGVLDRVRITTTNGTDLFTGGTINILYEG